MAMATESRPSRAAPARIASRAGIRDSPPSRENLFCPTYFVWRKVSKASAWLSFRRIWWRSASVSLARGRSRRSWNQRRWAGSVMCMYSNPMDEQ
jgi:hypothetical protein